MRKINILNIIQAPGEAVLASMLSYMLIGQIWSIGRNCSKIRTSIISIMLSTLPIQNSAYHGSWMRKMWTRPDPTRSPLSLMLHLITTRSPE